MELSEKEESLRQSLEESQSMLRIYNHEALIKRNNQLIGENERLVSNVNLVKSNFDCVEKEASDIDFQNKILG